MSIKETEKKPFVMNLQLFGSPFDNPEFAAQAAAFGQQPSGEGQAAPTEQPQVDNPQNSPQIIENGGQPNNPDAQGDNQPNQPSMEQPAQAPTDQGLILGKFKTPEDVINGYQNLEQFATRASQEAAQKDQLIQELQAQLQMQKEQQMANAQQPQETQIDPARENEQLVNALLTNPREALGQLLQEMLGKQLQPLQQQIQPLAQQYEAQQRQQVFSQAIDKFSANTPDIDAFRPAMTEVLASNPELQYHPGGPDAAINIAYNMAKGLNYQSPQAILQNRDAVLQSITPEEKQQFINEYLQGVSKNNATPMTIANQVGGNMPITPENRPKSLAEASEMAMRMFQGQQ